MSSERRSGGVDGSPTAGDGRGRLPLGVQTFRKVRRYGDYYVDKTAFAVRMIAEGECYFLSRPRRFGKSLLVSTLKELFEGNERLFEGLFVHSRWDWTVRHPVLRLSFGGGLYKEPDGLRTDTIDLLREIAESMGVELKGASAPAALRGLIKTLHSRTGRRVVVLVDEYDKPILDALSVPEVARANRDFLRGLYGNIKDADEHVRFVFLTGVSKFSKVSLFSGLNNLIDITLNPAYSSICGFTETDLERVFSDKLEGLDRDRIRQWYNGYSWLGTEKVYNPYCVLMLLHSREFKAHWFETGSPRFLVDTLIERCASTPQLEQMIASERLLSAFDVDHITTEALLFQTGYLTITGTEQQGGRTLYTLDYPNLEVRESLNEALLEQLVGPEAFRTVVTSNLTGILHTGDTQALRKLFESFFAAIPHQWHTNSKAARYESYYATVFYTYFAALGTNTRVEDSTSKGRIDMTVRTPAHTWLFEFKIAENSPSGSAMTQMLDRGYADKYCNQGIPISLVAIEFSRETRNIINYETTTIQT